MNFLETYKLIGERNNFEEADNIDELFLNFKKIFKADELNGNQNLKFKTMKRKVLLEDSSKRKITINIIEKETFAVAYVKIVENLKNPIYYHLIQTAFRDMVIYINETYKKPMIWTYSANENSFFSNDVENFLFGDDAEKFTMENKPDNSQSQTYGLLLKATLGIPFLKEYDKSVIRFIGDFSILSKELADASNFINEVFAAISKTRFEFYEDGLKYPRILKNRTNYSIFFLDILKEDHSSLRLRINENEIIESLIVKLNLNDREIVPEIHLGSKVFLKVDEFFSYLLKLEKDFILENSLDILLSVPAHEISSTLKEKLKYNYRIDIDNVTSESLFTELNKTTDSVNEIFDILSDENIIHAGKATEVLKSSLFFFLFRYKEQFILFTFEAVNIRKSKFESGKLFSYALIEKNEFEDELKKEITNFYKKQLNKEDFMEELQSDWNE